MKCLLDSVPLRTPGCFGFKMIACLLEVAVWVSLNSAWFPYPLEASRKKTNGSLSFLQAAGTPNAYVSHTWGVSKNNNMILADVSC